jgi:hypothetical protein
MPRPIRRALSRARLTLATRRSGISESRLLDQFPWTSPNIWDLVVAHYLSKEQPTVFEYGTGASSLWHIRNLMVQGGTYIGVEHEPNWFGRVLGAVLELAVEKAALVTCEGRPSLLGHGYDVRLSLPAKNGTSCAVHLRLRPPSHRGNDPDGTAVEFNDYIKALDQACDVVVIDGRARKACVNYLLDGAFIGPEGLLVLMEAGRGQEGWLGSSKSTGTSDYQPEVQRMLSLGGHLVDGIGVERWPGQRRKLIPSNISYSYPAEACLLHVAKREKCQDN